MFNIGPQELVILLVIILVLFGGGKIRSALRGLGETTGILKTYSKNKEESNSE